MLIFELNSFVPPLIFLLLRPTQSLPLLLIVLNTFFASFQLFSHGNTAWSFPQTRGSVFPWSNLRLAFFQILHSPSRKGVIRRPNTENSSKDWLESRFFSNSQPAHLSFFRIDFNSCNCIDKRRESPRLSYVLRNPRVRPFFRLEVTLPRGTGALFSESPNFSFFCKAWCHVALRLFPSTSQVFSLIP